MSTSIIFGHWNSIDQSGIAYRGHVLTVAEFVLHICTTEFQPASAGYQSRTGDFHRLRRHLFSLRTFLCKGSRNPDLLGLASALMLVTRIIEEVYSEDLCPTCTASLHVTASLQH